MLAKKVLKISAGSFTDGFNLKVLGKNYRTQYPAGVWQSVPPVLRQVLLENLAFAETHWLPLILKGYQSVDYNTAQPFFEPLLFKNQLYDLLFAEEVDNVKQLTYLKQFYNLDFSFANVSATAFNASAIPKFKTKQRVAIIPFTFGKESLLLVPLCLELGIKPVLVYIQEPSQPYEEKYKLKKLKEFQKKYKLTCHFVKHQPGLFRYGRAFKSKFISELGWGTQVTLITLLVMPFVYRYGASHIFFGNEYSNNDVKEANGWKVFSCADQTQPITGSQNNLVNYFTGGQSQLNGVLEPLEEINIFYLLHHRYPELGRYQFSCFADQPLYRGSQWCHRCYKCTRLFLFARTLGLDPYALGFKKDLLNDPKLWHHYFGGPHRTGSYDELDFCFYHLYLKKDSSLCVKLFAKTKLKHLHPPKWYLNYFSALKPEVTMPPAYRSRLLKIFSAELAQFKKIFR